MTLIHLVLLRLAGATATFSLWRARPGSGKGLPLQLSNICNADCCVCWRLNSLLEKQSLVIIQPGIHPRNPRAGGKKRCPRSAHRGLSRGQAEVTAQFSYKHAMISPSSSRVECGPSWESSDIFLPIIIQLRNRHELRRGRWERWPAQHCEWRKPVLLHCSWGEWRRVRQLRLVCPWYWKHSFFAMNTFNLC